MSKAVRLARSNDKGIAFSGFRDLILSVAIQIFGVLNRLVH